MLKCEDKEEGHELSASKCKR